MRLTRCLTALSLALAACTSNQSRVVVDERPPPPQDEAPPPRVAPVPEPTSLDPRAAAPAAITGVVRDLDGQPVADAQVCAWSLDPHVDDLAPRCAATDGTGAYTLADLTPRRHEVHASAPARQSVGAAARLALRPGEQRTGVDLRLAPGGVAITGVVRNTRGGALAGAWVTNFPVQGERPGGAAATRTGDDGEFTLWVSPGPQRLLAHASGFARAMYDPAVAPGRQDFDLTPESALTGQVVDLRGRPIAGARVVATAHDSTAVAGRAYTDAAGRYRVGGLDPGRTSVRAEAPGASGVTAWPVHVGPEATAEVPPIAVRPTPSVAGRLVHTGSRETCPFGQVTLYAHPSEQVELAGPDGEVYFAAVPPGEYNAAATCPGAIAPDHPRLTVGAAGISAHAWEFAPGRTLRGVVVDAAGQPLPGVRVRAYPAPATDEQHGRACKLGDECGAGHVCDAGQCIRAAGPYSDDLTSPPSDATGAFTISGLPPVDVNVIAMSIGSAATRVSLGERDGEDLRLVARPPLHLRGVVVDDRGEPVPGANVSVTVDRGARQVHAEWTRTDADGRFTAFDLAPGHYRVHATHDIEPRDAKAWDDDDDDDATPPDPPGVRARIDADAPAAPDVRVVVARVRGQIRGVVRSTDGRPVSGAYVMAHEGAVIGEPDRVTRTDAAGAFTLDRLPNSAYAVRAHAGDGGVVHPRPVRVGQRVTLTLPPVFELSGRVLGDPVPDSFVVEILGDDGELDRRMSFTGTGGRWAVAGLPPGRYGVLVEEDDHVAAAVVSLGGPSQTGVELQLQLTGTIRGKLVDADLKTPLSDVKVQLTHRQRLLNATPWANETETDDDGKFTFKGVHPGPVRIHCPGFEPVDIPATIEPGEPVVIESALRLAPGR